MTAYRSLSLFWSGSCLTSRTNASRPSTRATSRSASASQYETLGAPCERGFAKALAVRGHRTGLAGTVVHGEQLRLVEIDGFETDVLPLGHLLLTRHRDVPGIVGKVGTILGKARINISTMQVARREDGDAVMLLGIDRAPDAPILKKLRTIEDVQRVATIEL